MSSHSIDDEFNTLIPEIQAWNNGVGIDPMGWVGCEERIELAIGYALVFWPRFVVIDDYVPSLQQRVWDAARG